MRKRRNHDAGFKARVALEAVKGERTVSDLAAEYGVHPTMINQWKRALLVGASDIFERGGKKKAEVDEETVRSLHAKIGELAVANDFFCPESSSPGPASEARDDRTSPPHAVGRGAMPPPVDLAIIVLLRAAGRDRDEPGAHAVDRPVVPGNPVLRRPADDLAPAERRAPSEWETHPAADAQDRSFTDLPGGEDQRAASAASHLSLPAAALGD